MDDARWKQYELIAVTVRSSLDSLIKANTLYYAVTGAIVSFYLSRPSPVPTLRFSLVVPIIMAMVCAVLFFKAASTMTVADEEVQEIARDHKLKSWPSPITLRWALIVSALGMILTALCLGAVILCPALVLST